MRFNPFRKNSEILAYKNPTLRDFINPKCLICGERDREMLDIHHINGNHEDNRIENLMILCANHHRKMTRNRKYATRQFTSYGIPTKPK